MAIQIGDCEEWLVHLPGEWENEITKSTRTMDTWCAVSNSNGIIAYFGNEIDAFDFARLKVSMMSDARRLGDKQGD